MGKPGWLEFVLAVAMAGIGFHNALTVKPGKNMQRTAKVILKKYVHSAGWIFAIGGTVLAVRILLLILKD